MLWVHHFAISPPPPAVALCAAMGSEVDVRMDNTVADTAEFDGAANEAVVSVLSDIIVIFVGLLGKIMFRFEIIFCWPYK